MTTSKHLIDSQPQLDALCDSLADTAGDSIACDTEFVRTQTYWPQLCLIQLALDGQHVAVDVLADLDTTRLQRQLLERPDREIFHAAKQDMEAFYSVYEQLPQVIFDTQVAAGLLGFQSQIGYAGLVKELLDIGVSKEQTRTDWSRRPLTDAQIAYALDDVAHLHELDDIVRSRLDALGRLDWAVEDSELLLDPTLYFVDADAAWKRLASIPYLPVDVQSRARELAAWREDRARTVDRPRQWVLSDKALLAIAHANPSDPRDLARVDELAPAVVRKQGKTIVALTKHANANIESGKLELRQQAIPIAPDKQQVKKLTGIVRDAGKDLDIAPEILATRKDIVGILNGRNDVRALTGWRREVIGERLLDAV